MQGPNLYYCRYTRLPLTDKLVQMKLGTFPSVSLSDPGPELKQLKSIRNSGRCPASEKRDPERTEREVKKNKKKYKDLSVRALIDLYLERYIRP